jgi:hypothetical protein
VVLVQDEISQRAHRELFSFEDSRYVMSGEDIRESILSLAAQDVDKMHIAADWEHLLMIALWSPGSPLAFDVMSLLRKAGAADAELAPFRTSHINDLFPWLYYGRRFDILRKVCNAAKTKAESRITARHLQVISHLVSEETLRIVASSL